MAYMPVNPEPAPGPEPVPARPSIAHRRRKFPYNIPAWVRISIAAVGVLLAIGAVFLAVNWPYRYRKIKPMLEDTLASQVTIKSYRHTYFPHPGFIATGLTMRRKTALNLPPLGSAETVVVQGSWIDLFLLRKRVDLVDITGLHIVVPAIGSPANHQDFPSGSGKDFDGPQTRVDQFIVHHSLLDIMRADGNRFSFPIAELDLHNVHQGEAMQYALDMRNAIPTGRVLAHGEFGPLNSGKMGETRLSGDFKYGNINLHDVGDINGTMTAWGHFDGTLGHIQIQADSNTPDFAVGDGRPTSIAGRVTALLNGINGDLLLQSVDLHTGHTDVHAQGDIKGSPKETNLEISVPRGRAEDVMRPFLHGNVPISGPVKIRSHANVAAKGDGFLNRLHMDGSFDIPSEKVTDNKTEKSLTQFSERAQGHNPDPNNPGEVDSNGQRDALSSLRGPATIRNGIVFTHDLSFRVAGAVATLSGTFNFHNQNVHLLGKLKMDTDISHTATGFKSFLLKPLAPFFKKKHAGAVVPIAVTGGPGTYKVSQNIAHGK